MRAAKKANPPEATAQKIEKVNGDAASQRSNSALNQTGLRSLGMDQKSEKSYRPLNAVQHMTNPFDNSKAVLFEDPSAALNLSEDRWNAIVQENRIKFENDKVVAKAKKLERNKAI